MTKAVLVLGVSLGALTLAACDATSSQETASETGVPTTLFEAPAAVPVETAPAAPEAAPSDAAPPSEAVGDLPAPAEDKPSPSI